MDDPVIRHQRSWRWGSVRILGLLSRPPVGFVEVRGDKDHVRRKPLYGTRIQTELLGQRAQ